jgi:hypothetical protein
MKVHGYQLLGDIADRVVEGPHHPTVMKLAQRACPQAQQLASRERAEVRDAVAACHMERIVPQVHPRVRRRRSRRCRPVPGSRFPVPGSR